MGREPHYLKVTKKRADLRVFKPARLSGLARSLSSQGEQYSVIDCVTLSIGADDRGSIRLTYSRSQYYCLRESVCREVPTIASPIFTVDNRALAAWIDCCGVDTPLSDGGKDRVWCHSLDRNDFLHDRDSRDRVVEAGVRIEDSYFVDPITVSKTLIVVVFGEDEIGALSGV